MSARQVLRYLPAAQDDLLAILDYIAQDSPVRAEKFVADVEDRIGLLERNPLLGRIPRHPRLRESGYRVLIVQSYLAFYMIRGNTIEIHRVVHGSRNLDQLT
jgi:plasmid stabilization system protein ParE